ncbi:hypothetical protein N9M01_13140 [Luminiphilus sp.]|nr:hypothetical protein [Luminiphilus sp.]
MKISSNTQGILAMCLSALSLVAAAQVGVIMEFTGGDVTAGSDAPASNIDGENNRYSSSEYVESGVVMTTTGGDILLGAYYTANAVIHGHWNTMTRASFARQDGSAFDMNYYKLTSNPSSALGHNGLASDAVVTIVASKDGTTESSRFELPPEDWGDEFAGDKSVTEVYLGPEFDGIKAFWFEADKVISQCFGMDTYYIDLPPPPPSTDNPIILGSGTIEDAIKGAGGGATPVPALPFFGLLTLGGLLGLFGLRKLKK